MWRSLRNSCSREGPSLSIVAKSQSSGPPSELNVFESSRGGGEVPKPTFARQSSCAGSAGLLYHLCPHTVGSHSFLPTRGGAVANLEHFPKRRAGAGAPHEPPPALPCSHFAHPGSRWLGAASPGRHGRLPFPSLPWLNILPVSSPAVLGCCSRQPLPPPPPFPRWESLVPAPRAQPGAAAGDLHCFSSPYQSQSTRPEPRKGLPELPDG